MPAPRRIKTRRAKAVNFAFGITIFWGITAFVFFSGGGKSNGELLALFSLAGIGAWIWAIRTIRADQAAGKSLAELQSMSPDKFEDWVGARFREMGYSVKTCGAQGDHGVDLLAEKPGETAVIQCKNYKKWSVGEPVLRDLFGAMHDFRADRAYLVTTGRLTQPAVKWAEGKPITVWDGEKVAELSMQAASRKTVAKPIVHNTVGPTSPEPAGSPAGSAGVPPASPPLPQREPGHPPLPLGEGRGEGRPTLLVPEPACPKCGRMLIERRNRATGEPFLACPGFPACRHTQQLPALNGG